MSQKLTQKLRRLQKLKQETAQLEREIKVLAAQEARQQGYFITPRIETLMQRIAA